MKVVFDPEIQGRDLSDSEIQRIKNLVPDCTTFSIDEPELTETLVQRMKKDSKKGASLAAVQ